MAEPGIGEGREGERERLCPEESILRYDLQGDRSTLNWSHGYQHTINVGERIKWLKHDMSMLLLYNIVCYVML